MAIMAPLAPSLAFLKLELALLFNVYVRIPDDVVVLVHSCTLVKT